MENLSQKQKTLSAAEELELIKADAPILKELQLWAYITAIYITVSLIVAEWQATDEIDLAASPLQLDGIGHLMLLIGIGGGRLILYRLAGLFRSKSNTQANWTLTFSILGGVLIFIYIAFLHYFGALTPIGALAMYGAGAILLFIEIAYTFSKTKKNDRVEAAAMMREAEWMLDNAQLLEKKYKNLSAKLERQRKSFELEKEKEENSLKEAYQKLTDEHNEAHKSRLDQLESEYVILKTEAEKIINEEKETSEVCAQWDLWQPIISDKLNKFFRDGNTYYYIEADPTKNVFELRKTRTDRNNGVIVLSNGQKLKAGT